MRSCESVTATATYDSGFDSEEAIAADAAVMKAFLSESLTFVVRIRDGSPGSVAGSTVAGDEAEAATGALHRDTLPRRRPHVGAASMDKSSARHLIARSRGTRRGPRKSPTAEQTRRDSSACCCSRRPRRSCPWPLHALASSAASPSNRPPSCCTRTWTWRTASGGAVWRRVTSPWTRPPGMVTTPLSLRCAARPSRTPWLAQH